MKKEEMAILIFLIIGVILFLTVLISFITMMKTRKCKTKHQRKINKISKVVFWTTLIISSPVFPMISAMYIVGGICYLIFRDKPSTGYYSNSDMNYNYCNTYDDETTKEYSDNKRDSVKYSDVSVEKERPYKETYCNYHNSNVTTIYNDDTVVRDDGAVGSVVNGYVYYNDGTVDRIGSDNMLTRI